MTMRTILRLLAAAAAFCAFEAPAADAQTVWSVAASSAYGFLQGAWPFGVVEVIWTVVALARWRTRLRRPLPNRSPRT